MGRTRSQIRPPERTGEQLDELFREHFEPLVRLGTLLTGSTHLAEELVMDAFSRLTPRLSSINSPAAYLRTSVVNGTRSHHRRIRTVRRQPIPRAEGVWDPEIDELWHRLTALSPKERACVVLRFYEDLELAAIAEQLDLPLGTVKSHLHRAITKLGDLVTEEDR